MKRECVSKGMAKAVLRRPGFASTLSFGGSSDTGMCAVLGYLDASSGSIIAGAIAAGAAGFMVVFKNGFHKMAKPFRRKQTAPPSTPAADIEESERA